MKKTAVAVVLLAIVAGGSPALLGMLAQSRITTITTALVDESLLQFTLTDYQRGWRSSHATVTAAIGTTYRAVLAGLIDEDLLDRTIDLSVDVNHGPVFTAGGVGIGVADAVIRADPDTAGLDILLGILGMENLGEVRARFGLSSRTSLRWTIPAMAIARPEGTFTWSGTIGQGTYDAARQRQVGDSRVERIELTIADTTVVAENLVVAMDRGRIAPNIWTGFSDLSVGQLQGTVADTGFAIAADTVGASNQAELNETGVQIDSTAAIFADSISGDGVDVADARFEFAMRNLDLDAMTAYLELAFEIAGMAPETLDAEAMVSTFEPIIYRVLMAEPELTLGPLSFNLNGGTLGATVDIRVDNEMLPAQPLFTLLNSDIWPRLVAVNAEADVDRDLAQWIAVQAIAQSLPGDVHDAFDAGENTAFLEAQARGTLIGLVGQGMLEETETGYRFRGSYENGVIEINGATLPMGPAARDIF